MKEFDPASPKWQVCCCHVLSASYIVATVESVLAIVSAMLSGNNIRTVGTNAGERFYFSLALCVTSAWLVVELALMLDIKRRRGTRLLFYVVVQGVIFLFTISLMVQLFMSVTKETQNDDDDSVRQTVGEITSAEANTFAIFVSLFFATVTIGLTTFCIYVILLLRKYLRAEAYNNEVKQFLSRLVNP